MHIEDTLFSLHINPYFLRLSLPGEVVEDDRSSAKYDPVSGYVTVTLTKKVPGENFKDLDVLAKLLAPPKRDETPSRPVIEVLGSKDRDNKSRPDLPEEEGSMLNGPSGSLDSMSSSKQTDLRSCSE